MKAEGRRQEAEGRREQFVRDSQSCATNISNPVDYPNPPIIICTSNVPYFNKGKPTKSERQLIEPSACMRRTETPFRPLPLCGAVSFRTASPRDSEDTPLELLCSSPETINPAIVTARYIQHLELSGQVTSEMMPELAKQAQAAIAQGKQAITDYNHSLDKLKLANPQPNRLPWGF